jgi:hypothetical protein
MGSRGRIRLLVGSFLGSVEERVEDCWRFEAFWVEAD